MVDGVFDRVADGYDEVVPFFATFGQRLVSWAGVTEGHRVLDVGAGKGAVTFAALRSVGIAGSVLAIDVAPRLIADLDGAADRLTARVMDAERLELSDQSYDLVLSGFTLHLLPNPAGALAEIFRVLRPGSSGVFSVPGPAPEDGWWARYGEILADFQGRTGAQPPVGLEQTGWGSVGEAARKAGFTTVTETVESVHLPLSGPDQFVSWLLPHTSRWLYDSMSDDLREEFRTRVLAELKRTHHDGGHTLDASATFYRLDRPDDL